ncbi:ribosomal-protein-alanine N-acetyltransferase [Grimontia celer]|uniref:Ribosomal-protein-alanine N-acetyltransferase n=1 Tax=Grimontia celer TaxID=1796497 RepID=A0A128F804_9GAMM|nr:GNAT family N-acetyltransferase [Grimontia celer]CZF82431.1 ribosomal-protein-alanine N-acetyltransferase [Grimontia celer]
MQINLRKATESDMDFLFELRDLTMRKYLEQVGMPTSRENYEARIRYQFDCAQIIEFSGKRIGLLKATYSPEENIWKLVQIQIHPDYQGRGIGERIIKNLLGVVKETNATVQLSVIKSNPAQQLYSKLGFIRADELEQEFIMICKP